MLRLLAALSLPLVCGASHALADPADIAPPPAAPLFARLTEREKIDRILDHVANSGAAFTRAGADFSGKDAAAQMRARYAAVADLIPSARVFIEQIATTSAAAGRPSLVRTSDGKSIDAATYFSDLLFTIEHPGEPVPSAPNIKPGPRPALGVAFTIELDCTEAPELKEWGEKARAICEQQYPILCELLNSEGFTPRADLKIVFKSSMRVPAATGGGTISVNAPYVVQHPDDFGMMVHELTHAVQQYRRAPRGADMGWLTEGIADYTRFYKYEPGADHSRIDPAKASYRDAYRTTAAFLNYLAIKHDKDIVVKLNARMREGTCTEVTFKELLNAEVADLWKDFVATLKAEPRR